MVKSCIALVLTLPIAWAQLVAPPQLGFVQDSARALRPAYGLAGNFILGPSISGTIVAGQIVTAAFDGSFGLLKTDSSLAAFDPQGKLLAAMNVAPGPALFAFSPGGTTALAYIASSNSLIEWRGSAFAPVSLQDQELIPGAVLAIAFPTPSEVSLIFESGGVICKLGLPLGKQGSISESSLAGVQAPLLVLPSGDVVYRDAAGIVIRKSGAAEVRIAASLPALFSLQQMNRDWVQLTDLNSSAHFAIRATAGREGFYRLPEQIK
jgi:hypothetical protein